MTNDYRFVTRWCFTATAGEVFAIVSDALEYPRWWPSVYLEVRKLEQGASDGLGRKLALHTRGWLPYTLRWNAETVEVARPHRLVVRATGDFEGRGIWTLEEDGPFVSVVFDWKLSAEKPLLRNLSFLLKPAFAANHRWAMEQGRLGVELELARRRARTDEERARVPAPAGPDGTAKWLLAGIAAGAVAAGGAMWSRSGSEPGNR